MASRTSLMGRFASCLAFALVVLTTSSEAACRDDLGKDLYDLKIPENWPADTVLWNVTTDDTLSVDTTATPFLKVVKGVLMTARDISVDGPANKDFCAKNVNGVLTKLVCKQDQGNDFQRQVYVTIEFTDDHPTQLTLQPLSVREQAVGIQVLDWADPVEKAKVVTDDDCGSELSLHIAPDGEANDYFQVSGPAISIKKALDYEAQKKYTMTITAQSQLYGLDPVETSGQLVINVEDVDDRDPVFEAETFSLTLEENGDSDERQAVGGPILARDGDTGINAPLDYSIVSSDPSLTATISQTGELLVSQPLDRETVQAYKIVVKASQEDNPSATATATVSLSVTDINDNRPTFTPQQPLVASIKEGASAGSHVAWLFAEDADEAENSEFDYKIHNDNGAFEVRTHLQTNLPELVVKDAAVFNGQDSVDVEIRLEEKAAIVGDQCDFTTNCGVTITVTIEDINDHTPAFSKDRYPITINDDQDTGEEFGKVAATDQDKESNAEIEYSLMEISGGTQPDCAKVKVDSATGGLSLDQRIIAGVTCLYTASACDSPVDAGSRRCGSAVVTVTVNESPSGTGSEEVLLYEQHIREGLPAGTTVMTLPVSGLATDSATFVIEDKLLKTAVVLDREDQDSHSVSAGQRDGTGITEAVRITVFVDNVNDNSPVFTSSDYQITLTSDDTAGLNVLKVSATDADGPEDTLTYHLLNMEDIFTVDPSTGLVSMVKSASEAALTAAATADQGSQVLLVEVRDSGDPPFKTTANVQVFFPSPNDTVSVLVPVSKDKLTKDTPRVESQLTALLGVSVQVLGIESIGGVAALGSNILLKAAPQDGQETSVEELRRLLAQHEEAIHAAFAEEYNDDSSGGGPGDQDDDDDDDSLSELEIILLCFVIVLFMALIILAVAFYRMRRRYKGEVSLLQKLNKNTSIYDKPPLQPDASTTSNGSVQATAFNQTGSPRRSSVNLVSFYNPAFVADEEEYDPTYYRIRDMDGDPERQPNGRPAPTDDGPETQLPHTYGRIWEVPGDSEVRPNGRPASGNSGPEGKGQDQAAGNPNASLTRPVGETGHEDAVYSVPRDSRNSDGNPVFRTTIDVQYPRLDPNGDEPSPQNSYSNIHRVDRDSGETNWSFRRNSKLQLDQSPITNIDREKKGEVDEADSKLVSPASSRHWRGSTKAGSESDSGLPSDRDLPLEDETDPETTTTQSGSGMGNSPVYPGIYPAPHLDIMRSRLTPRASQGHPSPDLPNRSDRQRNPDDVSAPQEPEPDYEKKVRFDEMRRRGEMVELPGPESPSQDEGKVNRDSEITAL